MKLSNAKRIQKFIKLCLSHYQLILPDTDESWEEYWNLVNELYGKYLSNYGVVTDPQMIRQAISQEILTYEFGENDYGNLTL